MAEPPLHLFIYTLLLFSTKYSGRAVDVLFLLLQNHNYSVIMRLGPLFSKKGLIDQWPRIQCSNSTNDMARPKHADKIYMIFRSGDGSYNYPPISPILPAIFRRSAETIYQKLFFQSNVLLLTAKNISPVVNVICPSLFPRTLWPSVRIRRS